MGKSQPAVKSILPAIGVLVSTAGPAFAGNDAGVPADTGASVESCVRRESDFRQVGQHTVYRVDLENTCAQRVRCEIRVSVMRAEGAVFRRKTVTLGAPDPAGEPAHRRRKSPLPTARYDLPVRATDVLREMSSCDED
ncbi:MAG: hypothetical protein LBV50_01070 [Novosphingobium sp.]|nr:hypothetical protein [Novosphingobium sp.]